MAEKTKCWLFDFDGTLVDSMPTWAGVHIRALQDAGIAVPAGFVETITPLGNYRAAQYTLSLGVKEPLEDYLQRVSRALYNEYTTNILLKPGVKAFLQQLKAAGVRLEVLTASPHLYVDPCLQRLGVFDLFEHVWSIEDFGLTKAQPEIYRAAAARLGLTPSECTMADDNLTALKTAKAAGMRTAAVYDDSAKGTEAEKHAICDVYIECF